MVPQLTVAACVPQILDGGRRLCGLPAPAKINHFLHITGQRPDGYHTLQSAFQLIDSCDRIDVAWRADGRIVLETPQPGVPAESDLVYRAAALLQAESGATQGVSLWLDKQLPMGGGLGGGSSDAATVLIALNRLWGLGWSRERLQGLALRLGADVPFFVFGRSAWVEGVGEQLQPVDLPAGWVVMCHPGVSVPTVEIFRAKELTRNTEPVRIQVFTASDCLQAFKNDMQPVVCSRYPQVARAIERLSAFGEGRMSGSGACCFVVVSSESSADEVVADLRRQDSGFEFWSARLLQQHPLADWLAQ